MGKVQKNPMRSDTEAFLLGRRVHIITLTEYFIVASFIEFLLYPFLRRTILRVTDEDLLPRQSVVQYVKGLAYSLLMLAILAKIAFILLDSLEFFNKRYFYWLTLSVAYSLLPEQRKDIILRWDLWIFVIGFSLYLPTLIVIHSIVYYLHRYLSKSGESPKPVNMQNILGHSADVGLMFVMEVPQAWTEDPDWQQEKKIDPKRSSHKRWFPSKWKADYQYKDPLESVKIIDQFVIARENRPAASTSKIEEPTS